MIFYAGSPFTKLSNRHRGPLFVGEIVLLIHAHDSSERPTGMIGTLLDNMDSDPELGTPAGKTSAKIMDNPGWRASWHQSVEACLRLAKAADRRRAVGCEHEIARANYMKPSKIATVCGDKGTTWA
jgi:hypothetical protein